MGVDVEAVLVDDHVLPRRNPAGDLARGEDHDVLDGSAREELEVRELVVVREERRRVVAAQQGERLIREHFAQRARQVAGLGQGAAYHQRASGRQLVIHVVRAGVPVGADALQLRVLLRLRGPPELVAEADVRRLALCHQGAAGRQLGHHVVLQPVRPSHDVPVPAADPHQAALAPLEVRRQAVDDRREHAQRHPEVVAHDALVHGPQELGVVHVVAGQRQHHVVQRPPLQVVAADHVRLLLHLLRARGGGRLLVARAALGGLALDAGGERELRGTDHEVAGHRLRPVFLEALRQHEVEHEALRRVHIDAQHVRRDAPQDLLDGLVAFHAVQKLPLDKGAARSDLQQGVGLDHRPGVLRRILVCRGAPSFRRSIAVLLSDTHNFTAIRHRPLRSAIGTAVVSG
ncbi:transcriptional regulator [Babesia caballi]|uniref:Transcriptional regulator n=1 Tax=Babesia caballi TaxID=5871 RepID=A0AAV4LRP5_BABCB|nr:transcriptional regulator [Babesia caballi]